MLFDCIVTLYNLNNKSKSKQEFPKQDIRKLTLLFPAGNNLLQNVSFSKIKPPPPTPPKPPSLQMMTEQALPAAVTVPQTSDSQNSGPGCRKTFQKSYQSKAAVKTVKQQCFSYHCTSTSKYRKHCSCKGHFYQCNTGIMWKLTTTVLQTTTTSTTRQYTRYYYYF